MIWFVCERIDERLYRIMHSLLLFLPNSDLDSVSPSGGLETTKSGRMYRDR